MGKQSLSTNNCRRIRIFATKNILVVLLLDSLSTAQQQQVYSPTLNKDPITKIVTIVTLVEKH